MSDISKITLPSGDIYNFKDIQARQAIPYGVVDSTSTSKVFTATVPGITSYVDGTTVMLKNGIVTSASGFTININGLGAKPVYNNMAAATAETTIFNVNYTMMFVYDSTRVSGGAWICYRGYDSNTNTIGYQLRTNSSVLKTYDKCRYYRLFFTSADGSHWVPANNGTDNSATSTKTVNQRPIDPFGKIVYCSANTNYAAEADIAATTIWEQYAFTLGYSFNRTGAALELTTKAPIYIKCAPQTNGSAIIDADTPYVQALPSTKDGKIYIFLGVAYSATAVELWATHPVYWHDGTGIRLWNGSETAKIDVDSALSSTSENPVQNKVINSALASKANSSALSNYLPKSGGEMSGDITITSGDYFQFGNTWEYMYLDESNSSATEAGLVADKVQLVSDIDTSYVTVDSSGVALVGPSVTAPTPASGSNNTKVATTAFVQAALPAAATATPLVDGTAAVGTSAKYAKEDHVHPKATYSKSDVGLGNVDNVQQYSASNPPPYPVTSVNGSTGAVSLSIPSKTSDLTNDSGFITGMYIGSYGTSTYAEVLAAYQANKVVYCRASSNANPATGSQNRMAFLAYVNDQTTPTIFEFQYYRSVSSHSDAQQGDQVYIYTLNSAGTWSVVTREAYTKMLPSTGLSKSYSNGALTFSVSNPLPAVTSSDNGKVLAVSNGAWAAAASTVSAMTDQEITTAVDNGWGVEPSYVIGYTSTDIEYNHIISISLDGSYGSSAGIVSEANEGDTVTINTAGDWSIAPTRDDTSESVTYNTVASSLYTLVMPASDISLNIWYDD